MFRKSLLSLGLVECGISASVTGFPNWQAAASLFPGVLASKEPRLVALAGPVLPLNRDFRLVARSRLNLASQEAGIKGGR